MPIQRIIFRCHPASIKCPVQRRNVTIILCLAIFALILIVYLTFKHLQSKESEQQNEVDNEIKPREDVTEQPQVKQTETDEKQKSSFISINYRSALKLREEISSLSYGYGVFFNIQVNSNEWFLPKMQVHLALQDSAYKIMLLKKILNKDDSNNYQYLGGPFARVLFFKKKQKDMTKRQKVYGKKVNIFC